MSDRSMLIDPKQWPQLSRLLDEALDLPLEAREKWLESLPATDNDHKEELRKLLRHGVAAETHDFLDVLPNLQQAVEDARTAVHGSALKPGTAVGHYVIEREIASGGMGAVWLARRADGLIKRPVALKLPHTGPHRRQLAERFAGERDILAELVHPNIARLYDAGYAEDGQPFLALEYVAGAPVTDYCDQHRLDLRQRLQLFQQVLRAVQYAHSSLVIHRDLKPSNVIVGNDGRAMLLDFGIAKLMAVDSLDEDRRVANGAPAAALTPDYAAPEQIAGQSVTTAADIYSLGVLLFELLTGERPYRLNRSSRAELEKAILTIEPPLPSESVVDGGAAGARGHTIKSLSRELAGDLDDIILKALKKAPANRYATADALFEDIDRYLTNEPVAAHTDSAWYRTRKFFFRHKTVVLGGCIALATVIATAAIALFEAHSAAAHARVAAAERDRALALSSRNEAVAGFLNVLITESAGTDKPVTISQMLERSEALVNAEFVGNSEHRAAVLDMLGDYYRTVGDLQRAEPLLRNALDLVKSSPDADLRRKVSCDLGATMGMMHNDTVATRMIQNVVFDHDTSPAQAGECLAYLTDILDDSDAAAAVRYGELALRRLRADPHPSPFLEASILASLADAERSSGHSEIAARDFRQALDYFERAGRGRGTDAIVVRNNFAVLSDATGNPKRSLELYDETLKISAQNDPSAPATTGIVGNRARALEVIGRYGQAHDEYARCLELSIESDVPQMRLHCLIGRAVTARQLGEVKAADRDLKEANELAKLVIAPDAPGQWTLLIGRGRVELANQAYEESRRDLDKAVRDGKTIFFQMTALAVRAELNLAEARINEAEDDARNSLLLAQQAQSGMPYSNRTGTAWLLLGRALEKRGDTKGSQQAFHTAIENLSNTVDADHPMLLLARQLARE
jgi:eukaryotic-like serine/threonine-protein kinase